MILEKFILYFNSKNKKQPDTNQNSVEIEENIKGMYLGLTDGFKVSINSLPKKTNHKSK